MKVVRADSAGFCMGVQLALNKLDLLLEERAPGQAVFTFGPIIHNPQVLEEYADSGVGVAKAPEDIAEGAAVVIRAHGVPRQVEQRMESRSLQILDATCPKVKKAQVLIGRETAKGCTLLLFGEDDHPEVQGLLSYAAGPAYVFDDPQAIESFPFAAGEKYCLAAQTTQDRAIFSAMAERLKARLGLGIRVLETICDATRVRQDEVKRIAGQVDFMIVAGGKNSGNTRRLAQVVADKGVPCLHVETAADLPLEELRRYGCVGLTAGASTPKKIIDEIERVLQAL